MIISFCNPIGKKRIISIPFEDVFSQLKRNLEELIRGPGKIRTMKLT